MEQRKGKPNRKERREIERIIKRNKGLSHDELAEKWKEYRRSREMPYGGDGQNDLSRTKARGAK